VQEQLAEAETVVPVGQDHVSYKLQYCTASRFQPVP
jgi:hypothetical protein